MAVARGKFKFISLLLDTMAAILRPVRSYSSLPLCGLTIEPDFHSALEIKGSDWAFETQRVPVSNSCAEQADCFSK